MAITGFRLPILALTILVLSNCWNPFTVDGQDILSPGMSLTGNQILKSENGTFELGFFSPNGSNSWYVGIWYGQISEKTIIWVANRDIPIRNKAGVLNLSTEGNLKLYDLEGRSIWSTDNRLKASRAFMLDSGNFVLVGAQNTSAIVWESFLHPTDTWLPGVKQWKGLQLISWKSSGDPATGLFSFQIDPSPGKTQILLAYKHSVPYWYSGDWVGNHFTYTPELEGQKMVLMSFVKISPSSMYIIYEMNPEMKTLARFVLYKTGELRMYFWFENRGWNLVASLPRDECEVYNLCGAYAACNSNNLQFCTCLPGFIPKDQRDWDSHEWWSSGCVRKSPLQCSATNATTDGFLEVINKSLPVTQAVEFTEEVTAKGCEAACLNNCSCTAFAVGNSALPICRLWFGDLLNARVSSRGESIFIRLSASQLLQPSSSSKTKVSFLYMFLPGVTVFLAVLGFLFLVWRLRRPNLVKDDVPKLLRTFTYKELQIATENFKHLVGSGAFGSVYKGSLADDTVVAVKKLEVPELVEKQFRAEISTIGNIHHINLVGLRGFCAEKSRRLLVYDYMPNGSLDSCLFRAQLGNVLDWNTRFQIALGTARGLVYLHEKCKDRIIHCDIKPANILLDGEFCPKVADFGMAKVVGRDFSRVLTTARGTRGYLAPEWLYGLPITPKADVFSFGMTLLEIISGRRNRELNAESSRLFFATWAATQLEKGNSVGVVDARIANDADIEQVKRAAAVAKLCLEEDEDVRPTMAQVLQILEGTSSTLISKLL